MSDISIAEGFSLNLHNHLINRGLAILGMRGSGKSYTSGVISEELSRIGIPYIIIDLMGEYFSLRERYPVLIVALGAPKYADIKNLSPEQAKIIAENAVKSGISLILDLKFGTMLDRFAFLAKFLEALYHTEEKHKKPLVLIMDEAHRITPEKGVIKLREVQKFQRKVEYWVYEIGATGRHYGIGFIVIARRVAEISKMTLSQCELKLVHKNVDPIDLERLREYGVPTELLSKVRRFKAGDAVVIGLEEPKIIHVKQRLCSHGAETPLAKPIETPDLAKAIRELSSLVKAPPKPRVEVKEEILGELEARRKQVEHLKSQVSAFKTEILKLTDERDRLKDKLTQMESRVKELETQVFTAEERTRLTRRLQTLENQVRTLKDELTETKRIAIEYEGKFERLRELSGDWRDLIVETTDLLGLEIIPKDIQQLKRERDMYKEKLEKYEVTERLKREAVREVLESSAIKSWIYDAKRFLLELKQRRGAFPIVLKAAIRMDPETDFLPEELQTGITPMTNRQYLKSLADKKLLWETRKKGRQAFRNRFKMWVAENIRRMRPTSPDEAIEEIHDMLREYVLR